MLTLKRTARESLFSRTDLLKHAYKSILPPLSLLDTSKFYPYPPILILILSILSHSFTSLSSLTSLSPSSAAAQSGTTWLGGRLRDNRPPIAEAQPRSDLAVAVAAGSGRGEAANPLRHEQRPEDGSAALGLVFFLGFLFLRAVDITIPHVKNLISA